MTYKSYKSYKTTENMWFGKIPKEWDLIKSKFCFKLSGGYAFKSNDFIEEGVCLIRIGDIKDGSVDLENCKKLPLKYSIMMKDFLVDDDDILIALTGATIGKIGQVPKTNKKILLNQRVGKLNSEYSNYYKYILKSDIIQSQIKLISEGSAQENISIEDIGNFEILKVNDITKLSISDYLDEKTSEIDDNISKNKKLISLLEEKKVALINQTVTKGLDPNVPMKDSGIEWIGEIPEHWEIKRLKYNCKVNPSDKMVVEDHDLKINFLPMEKVLDNGWFDSDSKEVYSKIYKGYTYFEDNDVLVAKITPCFENGKSTLIENLDYGFGFGSTEFHVIRGTEKILPKFIYYLIKTYSFRNIGQAFMTGTAGQKRVSTEFVENYMMVTPPTKEQEEIIEFLDNKISKIDEVLENIGKNINLLEEYKSSLIHHVVTGKIDVRNEI